jgi:hypothetical protein
MWRQTYPLISDWRENLRLRGVLGKVIFASVRAREGERRWNLCLSVLRAQNG